MAPSADDGLALRYFPVSSGDGTELQAWTNDVDGTSRSLNRVRHLRLGGLLRLFRQG